MNEKSKTEKTAFGLTEEKFYNRIERQERLSKEPIEDKALKQFVKEPEGKSKLTLGYLSVFFLFAVMLSASVIAESKNSMEPYVAIPIILLSLCGMIICIKNIKKEQEENNKRYK